MKKIVTLLALAAVLVPLHAQRISLADKERAEALVRQMTLEEKVNFIAGAVDGFHTYPVERLGIPSVRMCDGPQGVRNNTQSTLYPCGVAAAASWNRDLVAGMGRGIAQDAKARGVGIMLGPGVNIYRNAVNGRNFEYYGEDPYLASETAVQYIKGMQGEGVMATIKHFALNNSEYDRHGTSSLVDERTMNEIYFPTFRKAVEEARVGAVMTSYNMVNGIHAPENPWLIRETLRGRWGFEGLVMSDWTSTYSTLGCIKGGLDLEMPKNYVYRYDIIKEMIDNGVVSESEIDEKVQHILQAFIAFGFLDKPLQDATIAEDNAASRQAALDLALEAPVLLKNDGTLPLKAGKKNRFLLIGPMADVMPCGGGSGEVHPFENRSITMKQGFAALCKNRPFDCLTEGYDTPSAIALMDKASAVVVAVGYGKKAEKENSDRTFALPEGQDELIDLALKHNSHVVVVVVSGGEVDMSRWHDRVSAILYSWYDGQDLGTAVAKILTGEVNPSGRLPMTFWGNQENNPAFNNYKPTMTAFANAVSKGHKARYERYVYTEYREGIFHGYRGIAHFGKKPLYPFGYGLSYTKFDHNGLTAKPEGEGFKVEVIVRNLGEVTGSDVVQVYVSPVSPKVLRPVRELKGYQKVSLEKGLARTARIFLPRSAFAYYDVETHDWKVEPGRYKVQIGASSEDILCETEVIL